LRALPAHSDELMNEENTVDFIKVWGHCMNFLEDASLMSDVLKGLKKFVYRCRIGFVR
jgi:hypothetical protein